MLHNCLSPLKLETKAGAAAADLPDVGCGTGLAQPTLRLGEGCVT
jgi:predicted TPR repeat methyltransferase